MMPSRVHIFGASGSGTTTLASALAAAHEMRSRSLHEAWLADVRVPSLRLEGTRSVAGQLRLIEAAVEPST